MESDRIDENVRGVAQAFNAFGVQLLAALTGEAPEKTVVISPVSIAIAFSMLLGGARDGTEKAMRETLGLERIDLETLDQACATLLTSLTGADPNVTLALADALWILPGIGIDPEFAGRLRSSYEAEIANLDFGAPEAQETINSWVKSHTGEKIFPILDELDPRTILVLVNALWFKGLWSMPFDPEETRDAEFTRADGTRVPCRMMFQSGAFEHYQDRFVEAIRLPYGEGRFSLSVFLPQKGIALRQVLDSLILGHPQKRFHQQQVEIRLPRFRAEHGTDLAAILPGLGMGIAFQDEADFSGIGAGHLVISRVIHKVLLEVDEKGSEAAAATVIEMMRSLPPEMVVDRPFVCTIRDDWSGLLLFVGWIAEPGGIGS